MYQTPYSQSWNQTTCSTCAPVLPACDTCAPSTSTQQLIVETVCADCQTLSRVRTVDKLTGALIGTEQFYSATGALVSTPVSFLPGVCQNQVVTQHFKVIQAGADTLVNDLIFQVQTICQPGNRVLIEAWFNKSKGGIPIAKPAAGTIAYQPQGDQTGTLIWEEYTGIDRGLNGSNKTFVTAQAFQPGTLKLYLDGQLQTALGDYQEVGTSGFTLADAPVSDQIIQVSYALLGTGLVASLPVYNPGDGISKSGTTFSVKSASSRIVVSSAGIDLGTSPVVAGSYTAASITIDAYGRVLSASSNTLESHSYLNTYTTAKSASVQQSFD